MNSCQYCQAQIQAYKTTWQIKCLQHAFENIRLWVERKRGTLAHSSREGENGEEEATFNKKKKHTISITYPEEKSLALYSVSVCLTLWDSLSVSVHLFVSLSVCVLSVLSFQGCASCLFVSLESASLFLSLSHWLSFCPCVFLCLWVSLSLSVFPNKQASFRAKHLHLMCFDCSYNSWLKRNMLLYRKK